MTKLTFDVDFNKDPKEILKEIQERAEAEVAKRESKIKSAVFLSKLHEKVNEEIGTEYKSINDLIRALTQFANPKLKEKISATSSSGRRITVSMTRELFDEIKSKLAEPNPNKAAIARETGASVVQVRKVAIGGYDAKFKNTARVSKTIPVLDKPNIIEKQSDRASKSSPKALPSPAQTEEPPQSQSLIKETTPHSSYNKLPFAPPSMGEELADEPTPVTPPPVKSFELPKSISDKQGVIPASGGKKVTSTKKNLPKMTKKEKSSLNLKIKPSSEKSSRNLKLTRPPMKPPSA